MPKKTDAQKKEKDIKKLAIDSTFGMKNKNKSKAVQQQVKNIAAMAKGGLSKLQSEIYNEKKQKNKIAEEQKLMADVFARNAPKSEKPISGLPTKVSICQFFKAGLCQKGKKCKFSHDLTRDPMMTQKIDLYTDQRELMFKKENGEKLEGKHLKEAVEFNDKKYQNAGKSEKICKHFMEAIEKGRYGWMWICPNGYDCIFKHCLPSDYQIKKDKEDTEKQEEIDLFEDIDNKRDALHSSNLTQVTEQRFFDWLKVRHQKQKKEQEEKIKEELKVLGIKAKKGLTGRQLFEKDAEIFMDDDDAVEEYERDGNVDGLVEETGKLEINAEVFADEELPDFD